MLNGRLCLNIRIRRKNSLGDILDAVGGSHDFETAVTSNVGRLALPLRFRKSKLAGMWKASDAAVDRSALFRVLDAYLGDFPKSWKIQRIAGIVNLSESDLASLVDSDDDSTRRVSRLIVLDSADESSDESLLHKGLKDSLASIRIDAVRLTHTGKDRTRFYNHLIRLIREDPDSQVRRAAGTRLRKSFADLYSVNFDGLPPLSRMLILDALEGHSRVDEERAEILLSSEDGEAAFRAARRLLKWGTLEKLFYSDTNNALLTQAAKLGVVDYLERMKPNSETQESALKLAQIAKREDLIRLFAGVDHKPTQNRSTFGVIRCEQFVMDLVNLEEPLRDACLATLNLQSAGLRESIETAFPAPDSDISAVVLFAMARRGGWKEWSDRIMAGLSSVDPDLRCDAALTIGEIAPEEAAPPLASLLNDPIHRVRQRAAQTLTSLPAGGGNSFLMDFLMKEKDESVLESAMSGIRAAGAEAVGQLIQDQQEVMEAKTAGRLISEGFDARAMKGLLNAYSDREKLILVMKYAGAQAAESLLATWSQIGNHERKHLMRGLIASGWARSVLSELSTGKNATMRRVSALTSAMSLDERREIFEPVLEEADRSMRRFIRRIMRS